MVAEQWTFFETEVTFGEDEWELLTCNIWKYVFVVKTFNNYSHFVRLCIEGILN